LKNPFQTGAPEDDPEAAREGAPGAAGQADAARAASSAAATPGHPATRPEDRVAELEAELATVKDTWLRTEADLQNARRRAARDVGEAERRAFERALTTLLTFADDLERALGAAAEAGEKGPLVTGVELVLSRLLESLRCYGVEQLDPLGQPFNPHEHEALMTAPSTAVPGGHVSQVIAKGYRHGERLVRPARVLVSSGPQGTAAHPGPGSAAAGER